MALGASEVQVGQGGGCQTERKHREDGQIWSDYGACLQVVVAVYSGANTALSRFSKGWGRFASSSWSCCC